MSDVIETTLDGIRLIQLNHDNPHNPFSRALETAVKQALDRADSDDSVEAIVVHGGEGRSFSAGGDFNEVKNLSSPEQIDAWIDRVNELYTSVLKLTKPSVAAIDGHAVGMGFQFGMMFDWRIMTGRATLNMPELRHGIGCSVGASILSELLTWNAMRDIIYRCEPMTAAQALDHGLINHIAEPAQLLEDALKMARALASYPQVAFRSTKRVVNRSMIARLDSSSADSKQVHRAAFGARDAQRHFQNILKDKYAKAA
ncbi:enoyl-CoA hydratase/isomerase family protein [Oxalobacteraceae bacterium]|nr:enoyl-CoA hydratase/isomerase family protein [Oxalobacteraceae bacterium]